MRFLHWLSLSGAGMLRARGVGAGVDTSWLQDFLTLVETRNFTRAAARRNISQAAFSRRIQSLEAWAGTALFDRDSFPPTLTPAGEQMRQHAADLLGRLMDARGELAGRPVFGRDHVRLALPYVLSTSLFPAWWQRWTAQRPLTCRLVHGNMHDLAAALATGNADIMMAHDAAPLPLSLDASQFDRLVLAQDRLAPWVSRGAMAERRLDLPGSDSQPLPLLLYSQGLYFSRLVDLIRESAPARLQGVTVAEGDMADTLLQLAMRGAGLAWLPESSVTSAVWRGPGSELVPPGSATGWSLPLAIVAFKARTARRRAVLDLWAQMGRMADGG
jgi:DNA-binding transcriptional LysR family regulator